MSDAASPTEVWKAIPGYDGFYFVSDLGRVRREKDRRLLKTYSNQGYPALKLWKNGRGRSWLVHRLVLLAFVPVDGRRQDSNHKNGIRSDARLVNLEWCNRSENGWHMWNVLNRSRNCPALQGERHHHAKLTDDDVKEIRRLRQTGLVARVIAERFGITIRNVYYVEHLKTWRHITP